MNSQRLYFTKKVIGWVIFIFGVVYLAWKAGVAFSGGTLDIKDILESIPAILFIVVGWILADIRAYKTRNNNKFIATVVIIFLVGGILGYLPSTDKVQQSAKPTMTAAQVIEHVNQVLKNEYTYQSSTLRYEIRYNALNAVYGEPNYGIQGASVNEDYNRQIKAFSPQQLNEFKEQIRQLSRNWSQQHIANAVQLFRGISELNDIYWELQSIYSEGTWLVNVNAVREQQRLSGGQWNFVGSLEPYVAQYYFSEITGALVKK